MPDRFSGASAKSDVAFQAALKSQALAAIKKDPESKDPPQSGLAQQPQAVDDYQWSRFPGNQLFRPAMAGKVIARQLDRSPLRTIPEHTREELPVDGTRMVEVETPPPRQGQMRSVPVKIVE